MPGSIRENDQFVREFVFNNHVNTALDVGAGQGTYFDLLHDLVPGGLDGIEVWQPYIEQYDLRNKYVWLYEGDARTEIDLVIERYATLPKKFYDLVIFGDVLEHMTEAESLELWKKASQIARYGLISVPIVHYPQDAVGGNPYEVHVQEHLTPEHIRATFGPFDHEALYPWTGTFIKRF